MMTRQLSLRPMHAALGVAAVVITLAMSFVFAKSSTFRSLGIGGFCAGMPVYAGPAGPFVGYLIGPATIERNASAVPAIDISIEVDGQVRSAWRRERDVMRWYTPRGQISPAECRWSRPVANDGIWKPTALEFDLDARLWPRRFGRGWTARRTLFTGNPPI